jgi:hypothetical protein
MNASLLTQQDNPPALLTQDQFDTLAITEYNIWDYTKAVAEAASLGYVVSDDNAYFPQNFLTHMTVTLIKVKEKPAEQPVKASAEVPLDKPKAGRPVKGK